jgi:excisionase family DNA binding protein
MADEQGEFMTVAAARELLGVSKTTMTTMLKDGRLKAKENPLDKRQRLVRRADVEALARAAGKELAAA